MRRRRRPFGRPSFAGRRGGRRFFWYRDTPSGLTLREAATATHSDILIDESFWQLQSSNLNDTQRGGPRLERVIVDFGLAVHANTSFFEPSGDGNIALIPEFMLWVQSDQFITVVTSSASFDSTRDDERVLMDEIPLHSEMAWAVAPAASPVRHIRTIRGRYETKVKARLADRAIGAAWRGFFNTGSENLNGYTDWFRTTFLVSIP